jgi:DNA-binding CsgD family transcriptional regulator
MEWVASIRKGSRRFITKQLLTHREKEVLKLTAEGKTSKEIAELLFISPRTVENHRAHILDRLKLNNTVELVKYAIKHNYV